MKEIWRWEENRELEKVKLDGYYIRWIFKLDFCISRYLTRELGSDRLIIKWRIRERKYKEKIKEMEDIRWMKICQMKEQRAKMKNFCMERRGEKYYNRNG